MVVQKNHFYNTTKFTPMVVFTYIWGILYNLSVSKTYLTESKAPLFLFIIITGCRMNLSIEIEC